MKQWLGMAASLLEQVEADAGGHATAAAGLADGAAVAVECLDLAAAAGAAALAEPPCPIDAPLLTLLRQQLRAWSQEGEVDCSVIATIARRLEVPPSFVYVALGMAPDLTMRCEHAVRFKVCVAACLNRGAVANLDRLIALQEARRAAGLPLFDITTKQCLDLCTTSPNIRSYSSLGMLVHTAVQPDDIEALVEALLQE